MDFEQIDRLTDNDLELVGNWLFYNMPYAYRVLETYCELGEQSDLSASDLYALESGLRQCPDTAMLRLDG